MSRDLGHFGYENGEAGAGLGLPSNRGAAGRPGGFPPKYLVGERRTWWDFEGTNRWGQIPE